LPLSSADRASPPRQRWISLTDNVLNAYPRIATASSYLYPDLLALPHYQQAVKAQPQSMRVEYQPPAMSDEIFEKQEEAVKQVKANLTGSPGTKMNIPAAMPPSPPK